MPDQPWIDGRTDCANNPRPGDYRPLFGLLSGPEIRRLVERAGDVDTALGHLPVLPHIRITPFDPALCGPNSYDVHLGPSLRVYGTNPHTGPGGELYYTPPDELDPRRDNPTIEYPIPEEGIVLRPGILYLGSTVERTQCSGIVPWLDGRSSIGRLGLQVHATAGRGDDGFGEEVPGGCAWTLEITAVHPVRVCAGLRIGQLSFFTLAGARQPYRGRYGRQTAPTASKLWEG